MESLAVQFPSRAFAHIAPPWAQALHASPGQLMRFRPSHPSDDLMLTERDLDLTPHGGFADDVESRPPGQRPR